MATAPSIRILRLRDLSMKIGLRSSSIYDRLNKNSPRFDPTFPKPIKLGQSSAIGFVEGEVDAWLEAQIEASRAKVA
ncbi:helix-turn-helix transcriptional regulator [Nevskia sp.]|uniref:helix-turn-helix transcriptional regulator n=1 Tax=Nevskia sp. TaxID=1929292 RepID=UPI003F6EDEC8